MITHQGKLSPTTSMIYWQGYDRAQQFWSELYPAEIAPNMERLTTYARAVFVTLAEIRTAARYAAHLEPDVFIVDIRQLAERLQMNIKAYKRAVMIYRADEQAEQSPALLKYLKPLIKAIRSAAAGDPMPLVRRASNGHYAWEKLEAIANQDIHPARFASGLIWLKMRVDFHQTFNPAWHNKTPLQQFRFVLKELADPCQRAEWGEQSEAAYFILLQAVKIGNEDKRWREWITG